MAAMVPFVRLSSGGKALFLRHVKHDLEPVTGPNLQCEMDQPWSAGMGKLALCSAYVFIVGLSLL